MSHHRRVAVEYESPRVVAELPFQSVERILVQLGMTRCDGLHRRVGGRREGLDCPVDRHRVELIQKRLNVTQEIEPLVLTEGVNNALRIEMRYGAKADAQVQHDSL